MKKLWSSLLFSLLIISSSCSSFHTSDKEDLIVTDIASTTTNLGAKVYVYTIRRTAGSRHSIVITSSRDDLYKLNDVVIIKAKIK